MMELNGGEYQRAGVHEAFLRTSEQKNLEGKKKDEGRNQTSALQNYRISGECDEAGSGYFGIGLKIAGSPNPKEDPWKIGREQLAVEENECAKRRFLN